MSDQSWERYEIDETYALFADRSFVDCSFQVVVAWGRRPQTT